MKLNGVEQVHQTSLQIVDNNVTKFLLLLYGNHSKILRKRELCGRLEHIDKQSNSLYQRLNKSIKNLRRKVWKIEELKC